MRSIRNGIDQKGMPPVNMSTRRLPNCACRQLGVEGIIDIPCWPGCIHCWPIDLAERSVEEEALRQIGICNIRAAKRDGVRQSFLNQAVSAFLSHLDVCDEVPVIELAEVTKHAIASQMLQRTSGEVRRCAHQQQMREAVSVQSPNDIIHVRKRIGIRGKRS